MHDYLSPPARTDFKKTWKSRHRKNQGTGRSMVVSIFRLFLFFILLLVGKAFAIPVQELTTLEGTPPLSQHQKNKELVFFWATWCGSCAQKLKADLPLLDSLEDV